MSKCKKILKTVLIIFQFLATISILIVFFSVRQDSYIKFFKKWQEKENYYVFYQLLENKTSSFYTNKTDTETDTNGDGFMVRHDSSLKDWMQLTCTHLNRNEFQKILELLTDIHIVIYTTILFWITFVVFLLVDLIKLTQRIHSKLREACKKNDQNKKLHRMSSLTKEDQRKIKNYYKRVHHAIKFIFAPGFLFYTFIDFNKCIHVTMPLILMEKICIYIAFYALILEIFLICIYLLTCTQRNCHKLVNLIIFLFFILITPYLLYCFVIFVCALLFGSKITRMLELVMLLNASIDWIVVKFLSKKPNDPNKSLAKFYTNDPAIEEASPTYNTQV